MDPNKLRPELIEAISIDDFTLRREFGRERGIVMSHDSLLIGRIWGADIDLSRLIPTSFRFEPHSHQCSKGSIGQAEPSAPSEIENLQVQEGCERGYRNGNPV